MPEVLSPRQRLLRRMWLLDQLPQLLAEAAFHRLHDEAEHRVVFVLWTLDAARGSLPLGAPRTDWQGLCDRVATMPIDPFLAGAVLGVLAMNQFRGLLPDLIPDDRGVTMTWALPGRPTLRVLADTVLVDGAPYPWTAPPVRTRLDEVRQASSVAC